MFTDQCSFVGAVSSHLHIVVVVVVCINAENKCQDIIIEAFTCVL